MKKSFQLSTVAIAIAASSSVMAATSAQTGSGFVTNPAVNGINVNGTLTGPAIPGTSKTENPFNVQFTGAVTINPADTDSAILTSVFGSQPVPASAAVTHNADGTKTITYQVANNTIQTDSKNVNTSSQIINDQKVELSSGISTTKTESDFSGKTVTLKYTPTAAGSNNFVGSNPNPVVPTVTNKPSVPLSQDSITVGKKVPDADNALTVTRIDATGTTESVVKASGISTTGTLNVGGDTTVAKLTANGLLDAKAGATVAGGLTADTATVNGVLIAGDTTVAKLTANGLLDAKAGATVAGGLTADTATVNGVLIAGDTTVAKLTANGLLDAKAGATVAGGLTADTATVNGALTAGDTTVAKLTANGLLDAKAGATVAGGLTADTATVNGVLIAGDTTVAKLTANGLLDAKAGATVAGGLTADTATVTGALIAGASTLDSLSVTNAATVNGLFTVNNDANVTGKLTAGSVKTSVVDLGTMSSTVTTNTAPSANRLTARYDTIDGNGSPITIYETQSGGVSTYYTINSGVATEYTDATVIGALGKTVAPTAGGTTQTQSVLNTTTATVKEVTDKAVTYGEIKTQQDAVTVNGTLNNNENINVNVGTGAPVDVNNQSVVTGIIGTDSNSNNIYGTTAKSKVTAADGTVTADNTTTLTADGIVVADVVSGKSTIVNATGITTDTLIVGGTNVKDTLDAHTTAIAGLDTRVTANETAITNLDNRVTTEVGRLDGRVDAVDARVTANETAITTLDGRVTTEVNRLDGRIDTVAADTLATANTYTDTKVGAEKTAREAADTQIRTDFAAADAATLTSAKGYTDTKVGAEETARKAEDAKIRTDFTAADAQIRTDFAAADTATLNSAKGYTDTKATSTLASANTYTDTKAAETLSAANAYTNTRVDQLNSRVDDVQKTAYRGIAIALAAQQAVPSIQPGQVAVFGGVGHYEGETAGSIGVVTAFTDRISASGALGFASGNEFGGRVGVAYVFGGK